MKKLILAFCIVILALRTASAFPPTPPSSGAGVKTAVDCDVAAYYAIGTLCQQTGDGKLYKGTGAAVAEVAATGIAADGSANFTGQETFEAGLTTANGTDSSGFVEFTEDGTNGTNYARLYGPVSLSGNIQYILPNSALARGSFMVGSSTANTWGWLAVGAANTVITTNGTDPAWSAYTITPGTNTFAIANGTASLDIAAGATLNIDTSLQITTGAVVIAGQAGGSSVTLPSTGTLLAADGDGSSLTGLQFDQFITQTAWRVFYSDGSGDVQELEIGASGKVLKSNGATSAPSWEDDANSGSATAINDIADAAGDGTIAQTGYKQIWTSTLNTAGAIWTMTNTTADLTSDVSFIDFKYTDTSDANGYFVRGYDNVTGLKWSIGADGAATFGALTASSLATSASADPTITLTDSDTADGTAKIYGRTGGDNDVTMSFYVEVAGSDTEYLKLDGATATATITPPVTFTGDITVGGADITLKSDGVKLTGSNGSLTILGLGDGQDEDVKIDLNTTANTIEITSPASSATAVDFNTLNLVTTGTIQGGIKISSDADGMDGSAMTAAGMYGTLFIATGAGTWTLPTAVEGMSGCLMDSGTAHDLILDVQADDDIQLSGTEQANGTGITNASGSSTGDFVCFVAISAGHWITMGKQGTWASQ